MLSDKVKIYSLTDESGKLRDSVSRRTRELLKYDFIPEMRRVKREAEEESKADNSKGSVSPKKPIDSIKNANHSSSESVATNASIPVTVPSDSAGNASSPSTTTSASVSSTTVPVSPSSTSDPLNDQLDREFPNYPVFHNTTDSGLKVQVCSISSEYQAWCLHGQLD